MRGQGVVVHGKGVFCGITPADAGTSCSTTLGICTMTDHPRGCGDKFFCLPSSALAKGSPPRMRGQANTPDWDGDGRMDHPRGCGDK